MANKNIQTTDKVYKPVVPEIDAPSDVPKKKVAVAMPAAAKGTARVFIPINDANPGDTQQEVVHNGHWYCVRKGEWVAVPLPVADILEHSRINCFVER